MSKLKVDFLWNGYYRRKEHWKDGLWAAMKILEKEFDIEYKEPTEKLRDDAVLLYWEAPTTINGPFKNEYDRVHNAANKKVLLFAGGPIRKEWMDNFDMVAVESEINEKEFDEIGVAWTRAFGINTKLFKPLKVKKEYDGVAHGTCASWKRQWLLCEALGDKALVFGMEQKTDSKPFDECRKCNSKVLTEQSYTLTNALLNSAYVSVNCADFWGGGQRATLEAMACNLPVVVMKDSPKNIEFINGAGFGEIVDPQAHHIKEAVERLKGKSGGRDYVMGNWTEKHYAKALTNILGNLCL